MAIKNYQLTIDIICVSVCVRTHVCTGVCVCACAHECIHVVRMNECDSFIQSFIQYSPSINYMQAWGQRLEKGEGKGDNFFEDTCS